MKFSKDYVLFCHITTQVQGEKYGDLLQEKGGQGFPHIVFMDAEGAVLAVHDQARTAEAFAKTGEKAKTFVTLKAKAEKGDKAAAIDFIIAQLSIGQIKGDEAEKKVKAAGKPTKEQQAKLDAELVNAMVVDTLKGVNDEEAAKVVGKKFYDLQKAGKAGPTSDAAIQPYYILMMSAAEDLKDVQTFEAVLKILKDKFGAVPQAKRFFEAKEKRLEELKAEKK